MSLKNELKGYIAASGETISSLANTLGISQPTLSQKINNESLRYKDALYIASLLGYDIHWVSQHDRNRYMEVRSPTLKNELKGYIATAGENISSLAERLGISQPALSQKINNESLRYKDAEKIATLIGYRIIWERKSNILIEV